MATITIEIEVGLNPIDTQKRVKAIQVIAKNVTTPALEFMGEIAVKKDASKKLLSKKNLIKTFM